MVVAFNIEYEYLFCCCFSVSYCYFRSGIPLIIMSFGDLYSCFSHLHPRPRKPKNALYNMKRMSLVLTCVFVFRFKNYYLIILPCTLLFFNVSIMPRNKRFNKLITVYIWGKILLKKGEFSILKTKWPT